MKRLVIFDLDGTLLNTITDLGMAANYALKKNGFPEHPIDSYPYFVGNGVRRLIERVLPAATGNNSTVERMLADFKEYYNEHSTDYTEPYAGIINLLRRLTEKGVKIAVASNKYQQAAERIIAHYFSEFDWVAVEGQKENVPTKPDPSVVFSIISTTDIPKEEILFVGDSGVDMETAWRACVDGAGVTWGFRSENELRSNHSTYIVNSVDDIISIVEGDNLKRFV